LDSEVVGDPSLDSGRQHGAAQPIRDGGGDGDEDVAEVPMSSRQRSTPYHLSLYTSSRTPHPVHP